MITYQCGLCKEQIVAKKENTEGIVRFDEKYWHKDCFITACHQRIGNKKFRKYNWQEALNNIIQWQNEAGELMKRAVEKDNLYNFLTSHYRVSFINNSFFTRLQAVYDGKYVGLLYPISPEELLAEWEYYLPQLIEVRKFKNLTDDQAIPYDLAIVLSKNAEYREIMEKKKVEEQVRVSQRTLEYEIDDKAMEAIQRSVGSQRQQASSRTADLFQEVMGNGD